MTLLQVKTDKHECQNITAMALYFGTRAYLFSPGEGSCYILKTTIVASFLHLIVYYPNMIYYPKCYSITLAYALYYTTCRKKKKAVTGVPSPRKNCLN